MRFWKQYSHARCGMRKFSHEYTNGLINKLTMPCYLLISAALAPHEGQNGGENVQELPTILCRRHRH
jgi:hypothetical protein